MLRKHLETMRKQLTLSTARIFAQINTISGRISLPELCRSLRTYGNIPTDNAWRIKKEDNKK